MQSAHTGTGDRSRIYQFYQSVAQEQFCLSEGKNFKDFGRTDRRIDGEGEGRSMKKKQLAWLLIFAITFTSMDTTVMFGEAENDTYEDIIVEDFLEEDYEDRENHKERRGSGRDTYQNKFRSEDREDRRNYRDNHNDRHTNSRGNEWNDRRNKFRNSDHDDSRSGFRGKKDRVRGSNNTNNRNKYGHRNFSQDED